MGSEESCLRRIPGISKESHDLVGQVLYRLNEATGEGAKQVEVTSRRKPKTG